MRTLRVKQIVAVLLCMIMVCGFANSHAEDENNINDILEACIKAARVVWDMNFEENPDGWGGQPEMVFGDDYGIMEEYVTKVMMSSGIYIDYDGRNVVIGEAISGNLRVNIPELRSLSEQVKSFAKDLSNRQIIYMANNDGKRMYEPEVIENVYRFAEWILTIVDLYEESERTGDISNAGRVADHIDQTNDTDDFSAQPNSEIILPVFRFDELVFSDDYAYTEEEDKVNTYEIEEEGGFATFVYTQHITHYYDADGNCIRRWNEYEVTKNGDYEGHGVSESRLTRIGDTDFFAEIGTGHFENVVIHEMFDDIWYSVHYGDKEFDVDEEGHLLTEEE